MLIKVSRVKFAVGITGLPCSSYGNLMRTVIVYISYITSVLCVMIVVKGHTEKDNI